MIRLSGAKGKATCGICDFVYKIKLSQRAEKDLIRIPTEQRIHIELALKRFAEHPDLRHDVVKVRDSPRVAPRYRIRIGEYRATFFIYHDILLIEIITIGKKKNFDY
jgi:mRNA interferase RelE/StbE